MKVKEVIKKLKDFNQEANFLVGCDEELNAVYNGFEISELAMEGKDDDMNVVIFPLSGAELGED